LCQVTGRDRDKSQRITNSFLDAIGWLVGMPLHNYSYSYVIYRDNKLVKEIEIPTRLSLTIGYPPFTFAQDSSMADHFFVDTGRKPDTTYNYRVAIKVSLDFGILEGITEKEEDIMTVSATTLSDK
jgi:hypothetical protein